MPHEKALVDPFVNQSDGLWLMRFPYLEMLCAETG